MAMQKHLAEQQKKWNQQVALIKSMYAVNEDIIDLDVGGLHMTTTKKTLTKFEGSVLEAMFSGRHTLPKHNNRVFIDRDGHIFTHVLNYLRTGQKPMFPDTRSSTMAVFKGV